MPAVSKGLTLLALLTLLHWFFGNLYEAVVISPNWIVQSTVQLGHLHGFFVRTTPTVYFVPASLVAPVLVWLAHLLNRHPPATRDFRCASALAAVLAALNAFIVVNIVMVLFASDYHTRSEAELYSLCVRWNGLNAVRMGLTAATAFFAFAAFRKLDRSDAAAR